MGENSGGPPPLPNLPRPGLRREGRVLRPDCTGGDLKPPGSEDKNGFIHSGPASLGTGDELVGEFVSHNAKGF